MNILTLVVFSYVHAIPLQFFFLSFLGFYEKKVYSIFCNIFVKCFVNIIILHISLYLCLRSKAYFLGKTFCIQIRVQSCLFCFLSSSPKWLPWESTDEDANPSVPPHTGRTQIKFQRLGSMLAVVGIGSINQMRVFYLYLSKKMKLIFKNTFALRK